MTTVASIHLGPDVHASRPAANAVAAGSLFSCTTHGIVYISDGVSTWDDWATLGTTGAALTSGTLAQFAPTTSAELAGVLTDETGSGLAVFGTAPTLSNPVVGTQAPGDNSTKAASTAYADTALALKANLAGATFTGDVSVPDEAYDATAWNGSLEVPTKNAVRDKIEAMGGGASALNDLTDVDTTGVATDDVLTYDGVEWVPQAPSATASSAEGMMAFFNAPGGMF